jgi:deoxyribodipyrimidine photo-lyase
MRRVRELRPGESTRGGAGPVLYWMSRDQRMRDNWALLHAQARALERGVPLGVVFALSPGFLGATERHYAFMLAGLQEVERELGRVGIGWKLLLGDPGKMVTQYAARMHAAEVVTDFDPLRIKRAWKAELVAHTGAAVSEVDAHNIVPCWAASPKREVGAYTLRPKLKRLLPEFLVEFPALRRHPHPWPEMTPPTDWDAVQRRLKVDRGVGAAPAIVPGPAAGLRRQRAYVRGGLERYALRNDPLTDAQSGLSPYLHFGQVSAQRVALDVTAAQGDAAASAAFMEELVVRRELSDNFCFYCEDYDSPACFPAWAQRNAADHRKDRRAYLYDLDAFEAARTHDPLWNAAQMEMVRTGRMHGYLRMYWGKKILEWTPDEAAAMAVAIRLNDRYELDGRDPNGYAGVAWCIGGVHDRPWPERPVFGKIRCMTYNGCRSKFDVDAYVKRWTLDES